MSFTTCQESTSVFGYPTIPHRHSSYVDVNCSACRAGDVYEGQNVVRHGPFPGFSPKDASVSLIADAPISPNERSAVRVALESPYDWPAGNVQQNDRIVVDRGGKVQEKEVVQLRAMFFELQTEVAILKREIEDLHNQLALRNQ